MSLERYSADRIAKFDFALENSGGNVLLDKCSPTFPQSLTSCTVFGIPLWYIAGTPKIIIQVSARHALGLFLCVCVFQLEMLMRVQL